MRLSPDRPLSRGILDELTEDDILFKVNEDLYFHREGLEELVEIIVGHLHQQGETDIRGLKTLTGMTRKFLIPVLESLDETDVSQRVDDTTRWLRARMQAGEHEGQQVAKGVQQIKHH